MDAAFAESGITCGNVAHQARELRPLHAELYDLRDEQTREGETAGKRHLEPLIGNTFHRTRDCGTGFPDSIRFHRGFNNLCNLT
jgi:hypothetical protein